jgi:DNA-directed RNA polymerase specialized sigma24 family protein
VTDPLTPSLMRAREELEKSGTRAKLVKFAAWRAHHGQDADDLLQEALAKVFDPDDSPWDPDGGKSFVLHVGSVINRLASHEWTSARVQHEVVDSSLASDKTAVDPSPLADVTLAQRRESGELRRLGELLLAELGDDDTVATKVLLAAREGCETPAELAEAIGHRVEEVYDTIRRLKYQGRQLLAHKRAAGASQLRERKDTASKNEVTR